MKELVGSKVTMKKNLTRGGGRVKEKNQHFELMKQHRKRKENEKLQTIFRKKWKSLCMCAHESERKQ